ncbi:MAG: dTDP-4-dehydrorhamnose 3,5-epimerase [Candidatus Binatota bacterium]|jgi:dTDP-4-dehydrorhamnose 3,5-epimerase|nr:dTDP-4-dehydrorhamnose 3,5-epimerase [Candidatus Binatota bacterium]
MIRDVHVKRLIVHSDDRGSLMEVLRADDPFFESITQTTFTVAYPGVIKAFHWHRKQKDVWFFSAGMAQVVVYDLREDSPTRGETNVFYMGERNPLLLSIPEYVAHGYRVLGTAPAALFYHTTKTYDPSDPDEERIPHDSPEIGFDWSTRPR